MSFFQHFLLFTILTNFSIMSNFSIKSNSSPLTIFQFCFFSDWRSRTWLRRSSNPNESFRKFNSRKLFLAHPWRKILPRLFPQLDKTGVKKSQNDWDRRWVHWQIGQLVQTFEKFHAHTLLSRHVHTSLQVQRQKFLSQTGVFDHRWRRVFSSHWNASHIRWRWTLEIFDHLYSSIGHSLGGFRCYDASNGKVQNNEKNRETFSF